MIKINLLPVREIRKKQQLRKEVMLFGVFLLGFSIILTGWSLGIGHTIDKLNHQIKELDNKKKKYAAIEAQIKKLERDKALLEQKIAAVKELKSNRQMSVRVLDELATRTPTERLWLNSLQHAPGSLRIAGVALDNATIAQYMNELTASPFFIDADLANSSMTEVSGNKLKSFSLSIKAANPDRKEKPSAKKR